MNTNKNEPTLCPALDLSQGFSRGNYANAYETTDLETFLETLEGSDAYRAAAVLGFFATYELSEVPGSDREEYEVYRFAVGIGAATIIVSHNHPSGDSTPSDEDHILTERLRAAGEVLGIPMVDHVIVTPKTCRSIGVR